MLFEFVTDIQENKNSQIYDLSEGFTKGNMFVNLYDPYKNYTPRRQIEWIEMKFVNY